MDSNVFPYSHSSSHNDCKARHATTVTTAVDELDIRTDIHSYAPLDEAHNDFFGLPSNPLSIYHTGPTWPLPSGPQADSERIPKEARPVCIHPISTVWHELGEKIYKYFDSIELKWTSIDPVRFAEAGKEPGPLFLWVGVLPGTLSPDCAKDPAVRCKEILLEYGISDVEIGFRESIYTRSVYTWAARPQLLDHVSSLDPTVDVRAPFTPALGLQIALKDFPYLEGTGCLYLCGEDDRVFLLTARHVVLPPSEYPNVLYYRKHNRLRMPWRQVIHLGGRAFQNALDAIMDKIGYWEIMVGRYNEQLADLTVEGKDRQALELKLAEAEASKASVFEFHCHITSLWGLESERVLGHVFYAPPISGDNRFTEDWALIELNRAKFDWKDFWGNVIYIGSVFQSIKMYPHAETSTQFKYPPCGLMQLQGFIKEDELRRPTMLDANGEVCLIVAKNGAATGIRLGRATGIESFVREYKNDAIYSTSMMIAVYPYSHKNGAFSAAGDSGSVVADADGRIVGMLTGGAGQTHSTDVSYVSAYHTLDERIKKAFPNYHLFPIRNPTPA